MNIQRAFIIVLFVIAPSAVHAQNAPPSAETNAGRPSNSGVYTGRDIYVPEPQHPKDPESPARLFSDAFLRNTRRHVGFSVGVSQMYTPGAILTSDGNNKAFAVASVLPQAYVNFEKKKVDFRLTYGVAYNHFENGMSKLDRASQNGTATASYTLTGRKTTLQFTNFLTSIYYDIGSFVGSSFINPYAQSLTPTLFLDRRRETRNLAGISLGYATTRRSTVTVSLGDQFSHYSGFDFRQSNFTSAAIGASYQINKWIYFNTQYTHYLGGVGKQYGSNNIEHLQIGGISLKAGKGWTVNLAGGIDSTKTGQIRYVTGAGQAGLSKTSRQTTVGLGFSRGYFTILPGSGVSNADTAQVYLVQSLSRRLSAYANGAYIHSSALGQHFSTDSTYGGVGLEVNLQRNLVASINYFLISQKSKFFSFSTPSLHRQTATVSISYYLPGIRPGREP